MPKITTTDLGKMGFKPAMFDVDETGWGELATEIIGEQSALLQGRIGAALYASTDAAIAALVKRAEKAIAAADLYQVRFNRIAETIDNSDGADATKLRRTQKQYADEAEKLIERILYGAQAATSDDFAFGAAVSSHYDDAESA
jgi:hypothetical protein